MHHRDPMRCAISMIGMNFAYQFFELQIQLPSVDAWLQTMHRIPLIRLQSGGRVHTTEYNSFLRQDLELIGAKYSEFTLHGIRNQRIGEAHEDPNMRGDAIMNGVGHSTGSHFDNYKGCLETSYMLNSVGYRGTDPQMLASHVETLLEYMYERPTEAADLVNTLYSTHRPEILDRENQLQGTHPRLETGSESFCTMFVTLCWRGSSVPLHDPAHVSASSIPTGSRNGTWSQLSIHAIFNVSPAHLNT